mmetsp:Transcript_82851/g.268432  ORF Transcript_82851/g.268432 Transcript_82851/m.268432 type:complete len:386 (-) Transcript_82851:1164-2321(-)
MRGQALPLFRQRSTDEGRGVSHLAPSALVLHVGQRLEGEACVQARGGLGDLLHVEGALQAALAVQPSDAAPDLPLRIPGATLERGVDLPSNACQSSHAPLLLTQGSTDPRGRILDLTLLVLQVRQHFTHGRLVEPMSGLTDLVGVDLVLETALCVQPLDGVPELGIWNNGLLRRGGRRRHRRLRPRPLLPQSRRRRRRRPGQLPWRRGGRGGRPAAGREQRRGGRRGRPARHQQTLRRRARDWAAGRQALLLFAEGRTDPRCGVADLPELVLNLSEHLHHNTHVQANGCFLDQQAIDGIVEATLGVEELDLPPHLLSGVRGNKRSLALRGLSLLLLAQSVAHPRGRVVQRRSVHPILDLPQDLQDDKFVHACRHLQDLVHIHRSL